MHLYHFVGKAVIGRIPIANIQEGPSINGSWG